MEIQEKLLKFKFHILFTLSFLGLMFSLVIFAPRVLTILAYFWPLFLSTALFLVAVVFFGKTSLPASDSHIEHHKAAAEDILGYVAGQDHAVQHPPPQTEAEDEGEPVPQSFHHTQSGSSS
ncbi:hypothetical protein Pint_03871 [Pistacia integerrima]|uniref:Uncharacterized protein n=1 Tax=Pistacia integerrima TaxID=434235 RepID=A0ACC0Z228_9ROSI|nr:hypothetical protein Pint_03871 [Pistacia integerrima]